MIKKYKCPSCDAEMKIVYDETENAEPIMCPFCGHEFDEEEMNDYDVENEDDWN